MTKLYSYAKELDIAVINLSQVSRSDVKGNENGLSLFSGKGSGEVENSSDFYLTLEKVIENNKTEKEILEKLDLVKRNPNLDLLKLTIHKNRRGKKGIVYVTFNRKNLRIKEFNANEIN
jgi:replicative DNA helicase